MVINWQKLLRLPADLCDLARRALSMQSRSTDQLANTAERLSEGPAPTGNTCSSGSCAACGEQVTCPECSTARLGKLAFWLLYDHHSGLLSTPSACPFVCSVPRCCRAQDQVAAEEAQDSFRGQDFFETRDFYIRIPPRFQQAVEAPYPVERLGELPRSPLPMPTEVCRHGQSRFLCNCSGCPGACCLHQHHQLLSILVRLLLPVMVHPASPLAASPSACQACLEHSLLR